MKKLNLTFDITDDDGKVIVDGKSAGRILAGYLLRFPAKDKEADILRYHEMAMKLSRDEIIEVSDSDFEFLKNFIIKDENMFVIAKAPIILYLNSVQHEKKE
ncbi:hypothetical protein LCGC14_1910290 [marine sediment metagenome]|uniref:Uncharacterized protein n=1 Tax=marine sediment metagenome TaxID=412755 RepID=A0A0F9FTU8_9ZZZZ